MEPGLMDVVRTSPALLSHELKFQPTAIDYAASKGGLNSMMMNLSSHLAEFNISVNSISPAMVGGTGMLPDESSVPGVVKAIPLGRLCKPVEVANAVSMFACTGFVTGQSLVVAGGLKHF
jgi:3-oxoacyl-[acyl-carrier protein] reductase